jgi:hypothetical protein
VVAVSYPAQLGFATKAKKGTYDFVMEIGATMRNADSSPVVEERACRLQEPEGRIRNLEGIVMSIFFKRINLQSPKKQPTSLPSSLAWSL